MDNAPCVSTAAGKADPFGRAVDNRTTHLSNSLPLTPERADQDGSSAQRIAPAGCTRNTRYVCDEATAATAVPKHCPNQLQAVPTREPYASICETELAATPAGCPHT